MISGHDPEEEMPLGENAQPQDHGNLPLRRRAIRSHSIDMTNHKDISPGELDVLDNCIMLYIQSHLTVID
jgi:hypothetical protein